MPGVDNDPNCQTNYEGQDGYAIVDATRYEAMEREIDRYKAALEAIRGQCEALHPTFQDRLHAVWRIAGEALGEGQ